MEKNEIKETGELECLIRDYVEKVIKEKKYELVFKADGFDGRGWMEAEISFGGITLKLSVHNSGYLCWYSDVFLGKIVESTGDIKETIVWKAIKHASRHRKESLETSIRLMQEELKQLKSCENGETGNDRQP